MSLAEELEARAVKSRQDFDATRASIYKKSAAAIAATDILETALRVGDKAPMFELPDAFGQVVSLADVLEHGPAIVSFYRGSWCPFCNIELRALQRELDSVEAAGATLVAISPNKPDESIGLIEENDLTFPILSDHGNGVAKQFGLVYEMEAGIVAYYREIGRDVGEMNDSELWELPVPATYVIDQSGVIRYAFVDLNHRVRAEPSDVVAVAATLAS